MRSLVLMRGAPGCGKSTWIKNQGLEAYTLSPDNIRMLIQSPIYNVEGKKIISQNNEQKVWEILFELLEERMKNGELTIIDATNSKTSEMNRYKDLADEYRYRIFIKDMTAIPLDTCKIQNLSRPEHKHVPEEAIDKIYSRFAGQKVPSGIKPIENVEDIYYKPLDLSDYKAINFIGDIHGCYTALMELLKDGIKEDEFYIFCGDYVDRGIENAEVLNFLIDICNKSNVLLLEGNHERYIYEYAHDIKTHSRQFNEVTQYELMQKKVSKKELRKLYRKIAQCGYIIYHNQKFLVTHGGISKIDKNLIYNSTESFIKGIGKYEEMVTVAETFAKNHPDIIQVFGHRNVEDNDTKVNNNAYCLEGSVERGGYLRSIRVTQYENTLLKIEPILVKNDIVKTDEDIVDYDVKKELDVETLIERLRESRWVQEKKYDNISAFNFNRGAFEDKIWNDITIRARGLFINTNTKKIVARAYNKFFNINEMSSTKVNVLKNNLKFPVDVYVKYNGFLGILGYDEESDQLLINSKSRIDGDYADMFKNILEHSGVDLEAIKLFLKENNYSMVFEVIDPQKDPHIIRYNQPTIVLLDVIENAIDLEKLDYEILKNIAEKYGLKVKEKAITLKSPQEFFNWYYSVIEKDYKYHGEEIEGFVIEDKNNFMVKIKLDFYKKWKQLRGVLTTTKRYGYIKRTGALDDKLSNDFYNFCKEHREELPDNIIEAREMFENYKEGTNE